MTGQVTAYSCVHMNIWLRSLQHSFVVFSDVLTPNVTEFDASSKNGFSCFAIGCFFVFKKDDCSQMQGVLYLFI